MDLYSGQPWWIIKNPLYKYYHPLLADINKDIVIIGSGITGALVAHELCKAGMDCAVIDKGGISSGSSVASTALLQYEIDTPLHRLMEYVGEYDAVEAYRACLQSIDDLAEVFNDINYNPDFKRVSSIFYASDGKGLELIKKEYDIRMKFGLPVEYLDKKEIQQKYGFKAPGALENHVSGQVDSYEAASHIIDFYRKRDRLDVYTHTEVLKYTSDKKGCLLTTDQGHKIRCKYIVIATGFEAGDFLPHKVMDLTSTYAIISEPLMDKDMIFGHNLLWETKEPYIYIRTTEDNRILVGGEDEPFRNPVLRDRLLRKKSAALEKKFRKLFPEIPFKTAFNWCGTFSTTRDGLPFIGTWPGQDNIFYALGYGGNGITFSVIAAQVIKNKLKEVRDERARIFGFERYKN